MKGIDMARSSYCYVVLSKGGTKPRGAFTVKYEMLHWLDIMSKGADFKNWRVWRCPDKPDTDQAAVFMGKAQDLLEE
jgi:hypothetical protein